jgi:P3 major capsid protein
MTMAAQAAPSGQSPSGQSPQQQNANARAMVLNRGIDEWLQIYGNSQTPTLGQVYNIPVRNVGLIKRFVVQVSAVIGNATAGETQTLSSFGMSNFFSNFTLTDLSNQQRVNTPGWHLAMIASAKRRKIFGNVGVLSNGTTTVAAGFSSPQITVFGFGNAFQGTASSTQVSGGQLMFAQSLAAATGGFVFAHFEVPVSYTDHNLAGGIFAGVTSATMNLAFTVNANMFAASGADATLALYQSSANPSTATLGTTKITVYQNIIDQVPIGQNGGPILPLLDLSTAYLLNNTAVSGVVQSQDNPIPYANFRSFYSTTVIFDNAGTLNAGSDVTYFALQSANYTNIWKLDPFTATLKARLILGNDPPKGTYYFDHRSKPINTVQYGNMQLIINPSSVSTGASFLVGFEQLALINQVTQAGSLYGS